MLKMKQKIGCISIDKAMNRNIQLRRAWPELSD